MRLASLKELAVEIKKQQAIADLDPGTEVNSRRQRLGKIQQAKETLRDLRLTYRKQLLASAVFAVVTGSEAEKFAEAAEKKYGCYSVNVDAFYDAMIEKVPKALYEGKATSGNLFEHIASALEDRARELDIVSYPGIAFESKYKKVLKDKSDLLLLTKALINDKVGGELVAIDAMDKIADRVLGAKSIGKTIPVVLYTSDESIVESLSKALKRSLTRNTHIISAGEVTEKTETISLDVVKSATAKAVEKSLLKLKENLIS